MGKTLVFTDWKVFSVPLCLRGEVLVCERPRRSQLEVEFRTRPHQSSRLPGVRIVIYTYGLPQAS